MMHSSLFLLSITGEEELGKAFVFQGIGMGVGMGLVFIPTIVVPLYYFKHRKGLAVGVAMSGATFGGVVFPTGQFLANTLAPNLC